MNGFKYVLADKFQIPFYTRVIWQLGVTDKGNLITANTKDSSTLVQFLSSDNPLVVIVA